MFSRFINQSGHVALYTMALLPFAMTLSVLAVDVSGWNAARDELQQQADRISFEASQALPNIGQAEYLATEAVQRLGFNVSSFEIEAGQSFLRVRLETLYSASFSAFLGDLAFSIAREATVQLVPADYMIIVSDGHTMRPAVGESPWGNSVEWPESSYWNFASYQAPESERWATQSCFNPAFSALKLGVISFTDALAAYRTNRLGLMFTPGTNSGLGYSFLRHVRGEVTVNQTTYFANRIGGFVLPNQVGATSYWNPYIEPDLPLGDEACLLYSYPGIDQRYSLPETMPYFGFQGAEGPCNDPIDILQYSVPYNVMSNCYRDYSLDLREAIYWRAAKRQTASFDAEPKIRTAIEQGVVDLADAGNQELLDYEISERGNLGYRALRRLVLFSDRLPDVSDSSFDSVFNLLETSNTELIVVAFYHSPGLNASEWSALQSGVASFQQRAANYPEGRVRVFESTSPEQFVSDVIPKIMGVGRQLALQR